jgi:opacity protein-like surface antigen
VSTARVRLKLLGVLLCAAAGYAQQYEIGATIGYGLYRDVSVNSAAGTATAGIRNRFTAGAVACENLYEHFSGEVRYLYQDGDPFISLGTKRGNIQGQSHAFSYDVLLHLRDRDEKLRPYAAIGVGAKYYRTTGPEPSPQPLPQVAQLVEVNQWRVLMDWGVGLKYRVHRHIVVRGDFRHDITPFPKKLFVPAEGATDRGLFQMFTPTFGLSYAF